MNEQAIITYAVICGFLLAGALVVDALLIRFTLVATIEGFSWLRKVFLEHYIWVQKSSYYGFPAGSRNQQKKVESYQSYETVGTHITTTQVNGNTITTTQPTYGFVTRRRTKYTYEIQEWVDSRTLAAKGEERATLHWPVYKLDNSTHERVEKTQEHYLVFFQTAKGRQYKRKLSETEWVALDEKANYILKVNIFGRVMRIIPNEEQIAEMPMQTS